MTSFFHLENYTGIYWHNEVFKVRCLNGVLKLDVLLFLFGSTLATFYTTKHFLHKCGITRCP